MEEDINIVEDLICEFSQSDERERHIQKQAIGTVLAELEKKDKIIDKMADALKYYCGEGQDRYFCEEICRDKYCDKENCKGRIIEYFEKKVGE